MKLIPHWKHLWRATSVQLAAIAGGIAAAIVVSPSLLLGLINFIPQEYRGLAAAATGLVTFVLPVLARAVQQDKLTEAKNARK